MRNRIALAICQTAILGCCWRKTGENAEASKGCASCQSAASAVIKAMREPTEKGPMTDIQTKAFLAVGGAMLDAMKGDDFQKSRDEMIVWNRVLPLLSSSDIPPVEIVRAIAHSIQTDLRPRG